MRVITPPVLEPITLAEVRTQIGITDAADTASDTIITRRITEARQWAEDYMQRAIITQTQEVRLNDFPHSVNSLENAVPLPFPNLLTVVTVKYIDLNGTEQTITASDYVVDTYSLIGVVRPVYGVAWPYPRIEANAVRIQYTCGYGTATTSVPDLMREGLMLLVGHWMNFQQQNESGTILARVPFAIRDIFDKYSLPKYI